MSLISASTSFLRSIITALDSTCYQILRHGPIPRHIAFIMDGNRRYAKKLNSPTSFGHYRGFDKLEEMLKLCFELGIQSVTAYAFSTENFKRDKDEVKVLMQLAKAKLKYLLENCHIVEQYNVKIKIIGNLALLPNDVYDVIMKAMEITKDRTGPILNFCFPYTARDEICTAVKQCAQAQVHDNVNAMKHVDVALLDTFMMTAESPRLDILIRTSEIRLSDFLLWQVSFPGCQISFVNELWPEFSRYSLLKIILEYQLNYPQLQAARNKALQQYGMMQ